jgi:hypothetical protein
MANLIDRAVLASSQEFQFKTKAYIINLALDIMNENQSGMSATKAEKRTSLAQRILNQSEVMADIFAWAAASKGTLEVGSYTDSDLEYMLASSVNAVAGVTLADG